MIPIFDQLAVSAFQGFCFGDGGATVRCTDCPCTNNADQGIVGGCLNSVGTSAVLSILGEASASSDTARLEVGRARPAAMTLLASSANKLPMNPAVNPCPPGSGAPSIYFDGLRCIGGPIVRHGARSADATGAVEGSNDGWGGQFAPTEGLVAQGGFAIGQERFFQAIYREDPTLSCGTGLNTTNAVLIIVVP